MPPTSPSATALSITNPLVKYRALLATRQVLPDPSQLRLALHLQKLYDRLKDYEPQVEYAARLKQISHAAKSNAPDSADSPQEIPERPSRWRTLLAAKERRDSLALTRRLTSHESALELTTPRGFMLHGEVGTGKSMLIDLFADCLPTGKKRRWHFNTFMLETFSKLESLRRSRLGTSAGVAADGDDYSLMFLARDLVETSPILFLDEFQMPDRVASKILTNLMTSFFHLGGVLIATSNRMPEELAKSAGMDYPMPAPSRLESLGWQFGLRRRKSGNGGLFGGQNEFAKFLDVLKARCEVWEMEGGRDWRRVESGSAAPLRDGKESGEDAEQVDAWRVDEHQDLQHSAGMAGWLANDEVPIPKVVEIGSEGAEEKVQRLPVYYGSASSTDPEAQQTSLVSAISHATGIPNESEGVNAVSWQPATLSVYGRNLTVPETLSGTTKWSFAALCCTNLGPADYITLASTYHTVILTDVPILTWQLKNEARRFITLLDALYECRCKLAVTAAAGPDDIFFPEKLGGTGGGDGGDAVYSETLSEVYQDATAPFRPNILSDNPNYAEPDAEPNYAHARFAGLLNADALEDDPPNKPARLAKGPFGRSFGRTDAELERPPIDPDDDGISTRVSGAPAVDGTARQGFATPPDFSKTSAFTGEDERFAYKRAQSRLWEMCGTRWWARVEDDWHRPLPAEVRRWERSLDAPIRPASSLDADGAAVQAVLRDAAMGQAEPDSSRAAESFRHPTSVGEKESASPFRTEKEAPPKFSWTHAWGTTKWGKKAGAWGQGVDGLQEREKK